MDKSMFDELLASVQEMDEIREGKKPAARVIPLCQHSCHLS